MRKLGILSLAFSLSLMGAVMAATPATPVPMVSTSATTPSTASSVIKTVTYTDKVNVNLATVEQLDTLPGIGESRAKAIVAGRPYVEKADLVTKKVLPQSVFDGLKANISLVSLNKSTSKDMVAILPGIGDARAAAIVKGRPYKTPSDLVTKNILSQGVLDGIKDLVSVQ
jgi:DNA uptake protein ComE-like DNA-binding protein